MKAAKTLVDLGFDIKGNYDANKECWDKFKAKKKGKHKSRGVTSFDPNEIAGPGGFGDDNYIGADANLVYTVYFENKDSAQAPATDVIVLDTIDKTQFDFETFSFNSITIADSTYPVESFSKKFRLLIDLSPRIETIVQVTGTLDTSNGAIEVSYITLDKSTLDLNEDVDLGFLPPNKVSPEGEGNFSYSVALRDDISHDAVVTNKALIFFDANKPIATNVHSHKIDREAPTSSVELLDPTTKDSTFVVRWGGTDAGCGIEHYSVFVSINDSAYVAWKSNTSQTSDTFFGRDFYNYKFYSIATDSLGLTQTEPSGPDTETDVVDKSGIADVSGSNHLIYPNPNKGVVYINWGGNAASGILTDIQGRTVKQFDVERGRNVIDLKDLENDSYILQVGNGAELIRTKIIVLQ